MKNPGRQFKDAIYEQFSRIGKAVSSPKRLEMLDLLCQGEKTVESLARETGLTLANTSQHLQTLKAARLVEAEKEGLYVKYRLAGDMVCEFFRTMRVLAEHRLAEVDMIKRRFLEGREGMEPVDRDDLILVMALSGNQEPTDQLTRTNIFRSPTSKLGAHSRPENIGAGCPLNPGSVSY